MLALSLVLSVGLKAQAADTLIDFDDLAFNDYDPIPLGYRSGALNTPDIQVSYRSFNTANDTTVLDNLLLWNSSYGNLNKVAFASQNGLGAEITLTPTNGQQVNLTSFDLAGYATADLGASFIQVVDSSNNVLWSAGNLTVAGAGPSHSSYVTNISSAKAVKIQWGTNWNIGVDNVRFSQSITTAAPEPTSMVLLGLGGALMAGALRRRKRA